MADQISGLHGLAGQFTTAGHSLFLAITSADQMPRARSGRKGRRASFPLRRMGRDVS
jgi:hypothetical protein